MQPNLPHENYQHNSLEYTVFDRNKLQHDSTSMKSFTELPRELRELIYDAVNNLAEIDEGCKMHSDGETAYYDIQDAFESQPSGAAPRPKVPLPRLFRPSRYFTPFIHVNATQGRPPFHEQDTYRRPHLPKLWHVNQQTRRECIARDARWNTMFDIGGEEFWDALGAMKAFWEAKGVELGNNMKRLYVRVSFLPQIKDAQAHAHVLDHNFHRCMRQGMWLWTMEDFHLLRRMHQQVPCEEPLLRIELTEDRQGLLVKSMYPIQSRDKLYIQHELDLWFTTELMPTAKGMVFCGGALGHVAEIIKELEQKTEEYREKLCMDDFDLSQVEWDPLENLVEHWGPKNYGWHVSVDVDANDLEIVEEWDIMPFKNVDHDTNKWRERRNGDPKFGVKADGEPMDEEELQQVVDEGIELNYEGTEQQTQDDIDGWVLPDDDNCMKLKPARYRKVYKLKERPHTHIVAELRMPISEYEESDDEEDVDDASESGDEESEPNAEQQEKGDGDGEQTDLGEVDGESSRTGKDDITKALQTLSLA